MGIPSEGTLRGQLDAVGFASRPDQMERVWELSSSPPNPDLLGPLPSPGVLGVLCPHDDYLYAGRVYRRVLPLLTAKTIVVVGVFHKYRKLGARDRLVFDSFRAWRAPDGEVAVSSLRDEVLGKLPAGDWVQSNEWHDAEHSVEALVYWLRHIRPNVEILPVIVPAASLARIRELASHLGAGLADAMKRRGWVPGKDVAVAISADAVHYGPDFKHVPFGDGGVDAYERAYARDRALLEGPLSGDIDADKIRTLYSTFVDPQDPDTYKLTWCGRFSIPTGLELMRSLVSQFGEGSLQGNPVAYATSVGWPELPVRDTGLGATAPSNLYHFVGYPGVAFTAVKP